MKSLFTYGRVLLGLCFVFDGFWNLLTYDTRALYLDEVGAPHFLTILAGLVFVGFGAAVAAGWGLRHTPVPLGVMLLLMSLVLLTDIDGTGIGDYPPELHTEVLFKEWVVHLAMLGALAFVALQSAPRGQQAPCLDRVGTGAAIARGVIGAYFIVNGLWQWYYFDIRVEHIVASGGSGHSLPYIIAIQLICGALVAGGTWLRVATYPLMLIITVSTIVVHGNLSESAPYPANLQIHQWFVKGAILAGLAMVLGQYEYARSVSR